MANIPVVSIIIPLYNSEKYIGECLDSILAQTLQNYEIIVVDDCSTDNSRAVVESYVAKFGRRLKLFSMEKNSGKPSLPRNKGLLLSRGEYVLFVDNDDMITPTALEELYTFAKNYSAEVVYCEHYYSADANGKNLKLAHKQKNIFVDKPTFETNYLPDKIDKAIQYLFVAMPWSYMVKRTLLIENEIIFPDIIRDDTIWTWHVVFCAQKILRIPNAMYIWRGTETSITRNEKIPAQEINFWLNPVFFGVKTLNDVLSRIEFFKTNPQYHYLLLKCFIRDSFAKLFEASLKLEPHAFYEAVHEKYSKDLGEQGILIPLLCSIINEQQRIIRKK